MKINYILLIAAILGFSSCDNDDDSTLTDQVVLPELQAGTADFSTFVALGASFTAGFADNALFIDSQENSFPNTLAKQFAKIGGGDFSQPLMSDNFGGLILGGNPVINPATNQRLFAERLVFGGAGPVPLQSVNPAAMSTTDFALNNPTGPFNNLGVPGAKSFHITAPGYGNIANLAADLANPYAIRLTGSSPNATLLDLALAQSPSFFTLSEIGGNDVLGYATTGGNGTNPITDIATFDAALNGIVNGLLATEAKGAIGNLPDITSLSFFTTVPHNPLDPTNPSFGPLIPTLNATFSLLNNAYAFLGVPERSIVFSETEASPVVIHDESLPSIQAQLNVALVGGGLDAPTAAILSAQFAQSRQATSADILTLPSASVIATVNQAYFAQLVAAGVPETTAGQFSINGVTFPLDDTFVLLPSEQQEIDTATTAYNASIASVVANNANRIVLVDLNSVLEEATTSGVDFDGFNLNTSLVFGGLVSLDGIHLTPRGYALMANAFLDAIDNGFGSNFRASGNVAKATDFKVNFSPELQ